MDSRRRAVGTILFSALLMVASDRRAVVAATLDPSPVSGGVTGGQYQEGGVAAQGAFANASPAVMKPIGGVSTLEMRFVQPSTRIYFDAGSDDDGEVDIFKDGTLNVALNAVEFYWANYFTDRFSVGVSAGGGIGSPAGGENASGAPVLLLNYGLRSELSFIASEEILKWLELPAITRPPSFVLELGGTTGFSTQEGLSNINDSAIYVGLSVTVPLGAQVGMWGWTEDSRKYLSNPNGGES